MLGSSLSCPCCGRTAENYWSRFREEISGVLWTGLILIYDTMSKGYIKYFIKTNAYKKNIIWINSVMIMNAGPVVKINLIIRLNCLGEQLLCLGQWLWWVLVLYQLVIEDYIISHRHSTCFLVSHYSFVDFSFEHRYIMHTVFHMHTRWQLSSPGFPAIGLTLLISCPQVIQISITMQYIELTSVLLITKNVF